MTKRNRTRRKQARKAIREYKSIVISIYYENTETLTIQKQENDSNLKSFYGELSKYDPKFNFTFKHQLIEEEGVFVVNTITVDRDEDFVKLCEKYKHGANEKI